MSSDQLGCVFNVITYNDLNWLHVYVAALFFGDVTNLGVVIRDRLCFLLSAWLFDATDFFVNVCLSQTEQNAMLFYVHMYVHILKHPTLYIALQ